MCPEKCLKVRLKESCGLHRANHPANELQTKPLDTLCPSAIFSDMFHAAATTSQTHLHSTLQYPKYCISIYIHKYKNYFHP